MMTADDMREKLLEAVEGETGKAWCPWAANIEDGGHFVIKMPETVFTTVIILAFDVASNDDCSDQMMQVFMMGSPMVVMALAISIQTAFAYYLHESVDKAYGDLADNCFETSFPLRCMALVVWVSIMVQQYIESWAIHMWVNSFKSTEDTEEMTVQRFKDTYGQKTVFITLPISGISRLCRLFFYVCVIVPKVLVETCVLVAGAGAVLRSENDFDLILNTLAATFINELDDVAFNLMLSATWKKISHNVPSFGIPMAERGEERIMLHLGVEAYVQMAVVGGLATALYLGYWCN